MDFSALRLSDLKEIERLVLKKEALAAELADIDRQLEAYGQTKPTRRAEIGEKPAERGAPTGEARPRGQLKERIIAALRNAGPEGLGIKDVAAQLGMKYSNVSSWFQSTGTNVKEIKKIGPARYAWVVE